MPAFGVDRVAPTTASFATTTGTERIEASDRSKSPAKLASRWFASRVARCTSNLV